MALLDIVKDGPEVFKKAIQLIIQPRAFVRNSKTEARPFASTWKMLLWLVTASLLVLLLYKKAFKLPLYEDVTRQIATIAKLESDPAPTIPEAESTPHVKKIIWWSPGVGVTVDFQDQMEGNKVVHYGIFRLAAVYAFVEGITRKQFSQTGFLILFQITLALVLVLCIYSAMWILKRKGDIRQVLRFSICYISSFFFIGACLLVIVATLCIHVLHLKGWPFYYIWIITVNLSLVVFLIRAYFGGFAELFASTKWRLFSGSLLSIAISWLVSPLLFVPLLYISLWLIPVYELIF